jgi:hypothetical protein
MLKQSIFLAVSSGDLGLQEKMGIVASLAGSKLTSLSTKIAIFFVYELVKR